MSFFKSNKSEEENTKLLQEILELTQIVKNHESTIEKLQEESIQSQRTIQDLFRKQNETVFNQKTRLDSLEEKISSQEVRMKEQAEIGESQRNEVSQEVTPNLVEKINTEIASLSQSQMDTRTRINTLTQALDMLGNGMEELNKFIQQQEATKKVEDEKEESGEDWPKQTTKEVISSIKNEQKDLFDKFSDIVSEFNANFHEELTDTINKLQDSHDRILAEIGDHYMPKTIGHELQQLLNEFSDEFKFETQNLRVQIANIKYYQKELQQFKQEIQTMIDHKINERFNPISRLLSSVTTKTEEISLYLKNSEITLTPSAKQSENTENHQESNNFTI
jgi:chromosome segregation ATPase